MRNNYYYNVRGVFYIDKNLNEKEILKYAVENNIIDFADMQEQIEMKKREEILKQHPYRDECCFDYLLMSY